MTAQRSDPGTGILVPERGESKPVGRTVIRAVPSRIYLPPMLQQFHNIGRNRSQAAS
jgi:hypothetical protein